MTEVLISTEYPYCEYGLAMVIMGLDGEYKDIRISIDKLNYINAYIDAEYPFRTKPIYYGNLDISKLYEVEAKITRLDGTVETIKSLYQPTKSEAYLPRPLDYQPIYPSGCIMDKEVTLCTEQ